MKTVPFKLATLALLAAFGTADAQDIREVLRSTTQSTRKLELALKADSLGAFTSLSNAVVKPEGKPPFPVVVLGHTCGGVDTPHMRARAADFLAAGFAVMFLDSFTARGIKTCRENPSLRPSIMARDAYQALESLSRMPELDPGRVFFVGYSWGAIAAPILASPQSAEVFGSQLRFRATAALYGGCSYVPKPGAARQFYLTPDTDQPFLMLMGSEDAEYKPEYCLKWLEDLKAGGKPVEWQVYPGTFHAWDQSDQGGQNFNSLPGGEKNVFKYNPASSTASIQRTLEFLKAHSQ
jgi:dienelactone hydrolase